VTDPSKWRWSDFGQAYLKLSRGISPAQIVNQTPALLKTLRDMHWAKSEGVQRTIRLQPLSEIHFNPDYGSDYYTIQFDLHALYGLMGIAALILVIAAINFINLSTAQSIRRAKEIGIRKVLGSSRTTLVLQFLSETFVLVLPAIILSLLIARLLLKGFPSMIPEGVTIDIFSPSLLLFLLLMALATTLLSGFYPAKVLSSYLPAQTLKGKASKISGGKSSLRKVMIVFQFSVSILFIIGTVSIGSQIHYLLHKNLGFQKDAIINFFNSGKHRSAEDYVLADQVRKLSGVEKVSVSTEPPETSFPASGPLFCKDKGTQIEPQYLAADDQYVGLYGLKILAGRNFYMPKGNDSVTEFLINETCSRQLGFMKPEDAIGHLVQEGFSSKTKFIAFRSGQVVGILADFHAQPLNIPIGPVCIAAASQKAGLISVKLSTTGRASDDLYATIKSVESEWKKVYPDEDFNFSFFDRTVAAFYDKDEKTGRILNIAMVIAILISCFGLLGLVTYMTAERTKEIGIRKVLGATVAGIVMMLAKEFIILVLLAVLIASPVAYYFIHQWLQGFAYRVGLSCWLFAGSGFAAILIALATISYQALKAALASPVNSLKAE
jgi:putative ABC transport system permease protein